MFICHHPTLGLRVASVDWGFFFILVKVSLIPMVLPLFDIINRDKALVNQRNEEYDLTSEV